MTGEILCTTLTVTVFRALDQDMTARVISRFAVDRVVALENSFTVIARNTDAITASGVVNVVAMPAIAMHRCLHFALTEMLTF